MRHFNSRNEKHNFVRINFSSSLHKNWFRSKKLWKLYFNFIFCLSKICLICVIRKSKKLHRLNLYWEKNVTRNQGLILVCLDTLQRYKNILYIFFLVNWIIWKCLEHIETTKDGVFTENEKLGCYFSCLFKIFNLVMVLKLFFVIYTYYEIYICIFQKSYA